MRISSALQGWEGAPGLRESDFASEDGKKRVKERSRDTFENLAGGSLRHIPDACCAVLRHCQHLHIKAMLSQSLSEQATEFAC